MERCGSVMATVYVPAVELVTFGTEYVADVAPAIRAHMADFLSCIESRRTPVADIEQGYMSAASCILANMSMGLGRSLQWDLAKGVVVGDAEANRLLRRPYRAPWVHPEPGGV